VKLTQITITPEHGDHGNPFDRRKTAAALAITEAAPEGVMVVDHGDGVSYMLPHGWITARYGDETRNLLDGLSRGDVRGPVTFRLYVPEVSEAAA
jgi:hypothetical protein